MHATRNSLTDAGAIRGRADELGFAACEVGPAAPTAFAAVFERWLGEGRHGEMSYLAEQASIRMNPAELLPGAKSVICVADWYGGVDARSADGRGGHRGRIARYAWGRDYHKVIRKRLFTLADELRADWPDESFRVTVDTAPTFEREHAGRAGLGFIGKHTLTIHPTLGSWLLLGCIVTTASIHEPDRPAPDGPALATLGDQLPGCADCTRCIDACPTDCIRPYELDAERCISYLTIEHRSPIDPALHAAMEDWIAGCDICQEVCPYNRRQVPLKQASSLPYSAATPLDYRPRPEVAGGIDPYEVLQWSEEDRLAAVAGTALTRIKLDAWKRNALIVLTNLALREDDPNARRRARDAMATLAADPGQAAMVIETARQCLDRLEGA